MTDQLSLLPEIEEDRAAIPGHEPSATEILVVGRSHTPTAPRRKQLNGKRSLSRSTSGSACESTGGPQVARDGAEFQQAGGKNASLGDPPRTRSIENQPEAESGQLDSPTPNVKTKANRRPLNSQRRLQRLSRADRILAVVEFRLPPTAQSVMLVLARHADAQTLECFPSIPTIAQEAGIGKEAVRNASKWLQAHGFLHVRRRKVRGQHHDKSHLYRLCRRGGLDTRPGLDSPGGLDSRPAKKPDGNNYYAEAATRRCNCGAVLGDGQCINCFNHRETGEGIQRVLPSYDGGPSTSSTGEKAPAQPVHDPSNADELPD